MKSNINKGVIIFSDTIIFGLSYLVAYWLRFENFLVYEKYLFLKTFWWVIPVKMTAAYYFRLYQGMWRYTSITDIVNIGKMSIFSLVAITSSILFFYKFEGFSRSVYIIDCLLTFVFVAGARVSIRMILGTDNLLSKIRDRQNNKVEDELIANIAIYGAGNKGEYILRTLLNEKKNKYNISGFIDDDPQKRGRSIHGVKIIGNGSELGIILKKYSISELLVAIDPDVDKLEKLNILCVENKVRCRIVPGYSDLVTGEIHISKIRDIEISDLLGRDPVQIDYGLVERAIRGKRVMITGAGGSIGSQLVRQIMEFLPSKMILIEKCENYLFELKKETDENYPHIETVHHCTDVTHKNKMDRLFEKYTPEIIFHAAANKHVPLMECNKDEVFYNNVYGTKVVADLAEKWGTEIFVLVSTDKVVNPTNAMGMSKKFCEMYLQGISLNSKTSYITVRFGNVLGSNGSVVPIFKEHIKNGGPIKVTSPEVTRYFMTIPEAVLLILQSACIGKGGEIFLLDMGKPVKIVDLAERMIRLAGYEGKVQIVYTGLRPGEKLHEELRGEDENMVPTAHEKISMLKQK
jgi:FlaA1/EpsC-like NDP-sugar epimerase